jgi:very-short-patch-repair endonuclease
MPALIQSTEQFGMCNETRFQNQAHSHVARQGKQMSESNPNPSALILHQTEDGRTHLQTANYDSASLQSPSPPSGERDGVRGPAPQIGKHRTRTVAARNFARHLRKKSTDAEKRLWRLLRDRRFAEFKFRRQYPCGIYFLDFYCTVAKLAVELDGGGHGFPDQRAKDDKRNQFLAERGIKVRRFWNHQLHGELEAVRFEIWHALMERTGRKEEIAGYLPKPAPSPRPSPPMGERESELQLP